MNTINLPMESRNTSPLPLPLAPSSLDNSEGIRETSDSESALSCLLRRFEKDAGNWIQESPAETVIRIRGLRKITLALFALGISLTCFLNSRLLLQGVEMQQLIVCNLGIMIVYVLAGILLFHDMTFKRKTGFQKEVLGVVKRIEIVAGQIDELDALRFKMLCGHKELVANQRDLSHAFDALTTENNREFEKAAQTQESLTLAQAELSKTHAAIADETTKLGRIQHAVTTLESECQAKRLDHSTWLANQQSEMVRLKAQQDQCLAASEQSIAATCQTEETAQAIRENLAHLQAELQSLEIQKTASVETLELLKRELLDIERAVSESNLTLAMTQEECEKVTGALAGQQDALNAIQEKHSELLLEIELLESEKDASQSSLTSSKLELACVELECVRVQTVSAEQPLLMQASAELEQLNATIVSIEQSICDMEQERSSLQRNIEYSNAIEAVASNRLATLNEQIAKIESDRVGLSKAMERLLTEIEEKSQIHDGLSNQNMSATSSLEGLLDSVEKLSRKEAGLLSACTSAEQKMGNWTTNVESLVVRVDDLTTQIATFEEQRLQAIEALENILEEIDLKSADRATIANSIEKLTQQISDLDAVTQVAQTRMEVTEAATKDTESALQDTASALQDTRNQLGTYEIQLSQASESCIAQQAELSRVQNDLLTEQRLLAQIQSEITYKTEDRIAAVSDLVDLEKLKTETQIACDDANAELERLIQQLDAMSEELMTKEEQSSHLKERLGQLRELEDELNLKHQKLDELDKQLHRSEQSSQDAREHLEQLQADTRTVQLELDRLSRNESELTLKSNKVRSETEQLEANYDSSSHKLQTLQHELSTLQMKRSQLESEIQASEQRKIEIQRTIDSFANEADEAQNVCKQWSDYGAKLKYDNKEVESEIAKLRLECKELKAEQDRSHQEKQAVTAGLSTLKGQRDTLNTEIANREDFLLELKEEQKKVVKQITANNKCLEQTQADLDRVSSETNSARSELDLIHSQGRFESSCVQDLMVQHKQLQGAVHGLTQVVEQLRADAVQHELALLTLKNNRELIEGYIREGKTQQLELGNRLSAIQMELTIACESAATANDEKEKHLEGIVSLKGEAAEYRCQIDVLQKQVTSIELELSANRENATRLNAKLEETRDDCAEAAQLLLENQSKANEIVLSINEMKKELSKTEQSIRGKQLQSESLDLELSEKIATLESIKQSIIDAECKTDAKQMQLAEVQFFIESLRSQTVAAESDITSLSERKAETVSSIAVAESRAKDLQSLLSSLEGEKGSILHLLDTEKASLDATLQERVQLESDNRELVDANNSMNRAILGLQSQRDELTMLVSRLDNEIVTNKDCCSQLQLQIESSSAQIARLEQNQREWMDKESTTIDQVARIRAELKDLESVKSLAKLELEAMVVPAEPDSTKVADASRTDLQSSSSEAPPATTVEMAEEILEEISDLATFDDIIVGRNTEPSEDPWSVVLG